MGWMNAVAALVDDDSASFYTGPLEGVRWASRARLPPPKQSSLPGSLSNNNNNNNNNKNNNNNNNDNNDNKVGVRGSPPLLAHA